MKSLIDEPTLENESVSFLPTTKKELTELGWKECDIIIVTGDAYVDHSSFGMALIGRLLEAFGFRVGILPQPDWRDVNAFRKLGRPKLFFGITAGNMDSMVNKYTSERRIRSNDAYSPDGKADKRPDRATIVYSQRCKEAYSGVSIVLGGIEASLRRAAHYDYWSEKVRRSVLFDARGDLLLYGNAERAIVELAQRMAKGEEISAIRDLRGSAFIRRKSDPKEAQNFSKSKEEKEKIVQLPSYEEVKKDKLAFAKAARAIHLETNPGNARQLVQQHGDRELVINPPPIPLKEAELDRIYELPFARAPHPQYKNTKIPAWEMIRFSITIERGCYGGCSFCSITAHEGRIIQNRSKKSILREIRSIQKSPDFTGIISDLGGATANMFGTRCKDPLIKAACRKPSCLYPKVCSNLLTDHSALIDLYRSARRIKGIKKIQISSGVRFDLALQDPNYVSELATHHVGGRLKIAPEHVTKKALQAMRKPGIQTYDRFETLFLKASKAAGKNQQIIPYFIASHPGTTTKDMIQLACWLKKRNLRVDQVQTFLPTPMSVATAMYHSELDITQKFAEIETTKKGRLRRLHKAFLRYHDPTNWKLIREALRKEGREELIGFTSSCIVPPYETKRNHAKKRFKTRKFKSKKR